jgi:hypothetical protein
LISACKNDLTKAEVDEIMADLRFDSDTRAEQLSAEAMIALCDSVRQRLV